MPQIKTAEDIKKLGTILCVGAHPDDETWIAGGILAAAARNGQIVSVITATKGEAGTTDEAQWPAEKLAETRAQELHEALKILGVTEHGWLGCVDGECDCVDAGKMALQIASVVHREKPDTVITFGPEGLTGHSDHQSVSQWCDAALAMVDVSPKLYHAVHTPEWYEGLGKELHEKMNVFFNIDEPPLVEAENLAIHFKLPKDICDLKLKALRAQPSQTQKLLSIFGDDQLPAALCEEAFVLAN